MFRTIKLESQEAEGFQVERMVGTRQCQLMRLTCVCGAGDGRSDAKSWCCA